VLGLFFVDNDIVVEHQNWLDLFKDAVQRYPQTDIFIPRLYHVHESAFAPPVRFTIDTNRVFHVIPAEKEEDINLFNVHLPKGDVKRDLKEYKL